MDFVLESDSDGAYSPRPLSRTRLPVKAEGVVSSSTVVHSQRARMNEPNDRMLHVSSSMSRAELMEAYRRLETPKAYSRLDSRPTTAPAEPALLDSSRERMSISNFIDSDTNGEDSDNFLTMPINITEDLTEKRSLSGSHKPLLSPPPPPPLSITTRSRTDNQDKVSDLELSGISDAEELLAEFVSEYRRVGGGPHADRLAKPAVGGGTLLRPDPGRLLHVDSSNSEMATPPPHPRFRSIKEELDLSKSRFRQSINELLESSPVSVKSLDRAPMELKEMVKIGSKLGENIVGEVEILEGRSSLKSILREASPAPRKLTRDELMNFSPIQSPDTVTDSPQEAEVSAPRPLVSVLLKRILWALFIVSLIFVADAAINVAILRQQAGLPLFELKLLEPYQQILEDYYQKVAEVFSTSWQAAVPH